MLVISVALVLGLMRVLYAPFGKWAEVWMGSYVVCLLDEGKLPALMGDEETDDCAQKMVAGSSGSSSGSGGKSSPTDPTEKADPRDQSNRDKSSGAGSGAASSFAGSSGRTSSARGTDGPTTDSKVTVVKENEAKPSTRFFPGAGTGENFGSSQGRKIAQLGVSNLLESEKQKIRKRQSRIFKAGERTEEEENRRNKVLLVKAKAKTEDSINSDSGAWNFGKLLRLAIILIIIVFTIFFLFIQGVRISKSMEK